MLETVGIVGGASVKDDASEDWVAAAVDQALYVGGLGLHPFLLAEAGATDGLLLGEVLDYATTDEGIESFDHHEHFVDLEAQTVDRAEHLLVAPSRVRSQIASAGAMDSHPGVAQGHRPKAASDRAQVGAPLSADLEMEVVTHYSVDHQVDELVFASHVAVKRGRSDTELDRQGSHRDRLDSLSVGQCHGGCGDLVARQRRGRTAPGPLGTFPDDSTTRTHCEHCTQSVTVIYCERCTRLGDRMGTDANAGTMTESEVLATAAATANTSPAARNPLRWFVFAVVIAANIMDLMDATIVNVAGPSIRAALGGSASTLQWLPAGYTLAFAVFLITGARLGDKFGRRRLFLIGSAGFTVMSAACALAPSMEVLIVFRVLQGSFGALMIPQGFGMIKEVFDDVEITKVFGAFGPVMGLSILAAPILAGALVEANLWGIGWRLVFLINVPVGIAAFTGAVRVLPRTVAHPGSASTPAGWC